MKYQDPKLELRETRRGWQYSIRPYISVVNSDGTVTRRQQRKILGYKAEISATEAKVRKQEVMAAINQGHYFVSVQVKFGAVLDRFEAVKFPVLDPSTIAKYSYHIRKNIRPTFGNMRVCDVDTSLVQEWVNKKRSAGLSHQTLVDMKTLLGGIFNSAKTWKLFKGDNPCVGVELGPKRVVWEKKLLRQEDLQRLLAAVDDQLQLLIKTAFVTGLRISELLGLQWQDVDLEHGTITVRRVYHGHFGEGKSARAHRTHQLGQLVEEFRWGCGEARPEGFVFYDGVPSNPHEYKTLLRRLKEVLQTLHLDFKGFGFHLFRRQNISWRQEAGASSFEAQMLAGHAHPATTWNYTLVDPAREREQVDRMLARLVEEDPVSYGSKLTN
jgi:integrase